MPSVFTRLLDPNEREVRAHLRIAEAVTELEPELKELDDAGIRARSDALRKRAEDEDLDELLVEAFALVREAARRTIGLRHFDVQLVGGIVLHQGKIAEMKTGEGKTLVASLPLYLNALEGLGAHLVTVNDYLARRDAGWMAPVYDLLGMSVGVIIPDASFVYDPEFVDEAHPDSRLQHLRPATRHEVYRTDITYTTNSELAFDYLRDNMAVDAGALVQRELNFAIVDEVDSILIDEARTPHIISGQGEESTEKYFQYARIAAQLTEEQDFTVDLKHKAVTLTEEGIARVEKLTGVPNIYDIENVAEAHQINQALKAKALFLNERDYLVINGEVVIVDEYTGRTMPGRRWSDGLHQAVEAKEGLRVQQEMKTLATISVQNYFRLYDKLAGMTGTALTEAEEFHKIYTLEVVVIPTNNPMVREDRSDLIYKTEESKFDAVIDEIVDCHQRGQPVLVGTVSVEKSERLARLLEKRGVPHNVLNAKYHEREALIVAEAGQRGAVTIATNMAGRGTDIVLGEGVKDVGGLHIIGTERHESRRIDNQLRGRSGRQGDAGSSRFYISLDDDLMKIFGPSADRIGGLMDRFEQEPIESRMVSRSIESAQRKVEGMNFDARKHLVEYDDVMNKQREIIYEERRKVLEGADTRTNIETYINGLIAKGIETHCVGRHAENWDLEGLVAYLTQYFPLAPGTVIPMEVANQGREALADTLAEAALASYQSKEDALGPELMRQLERFVMLRTIDQKWMDYLTQMEQFREGIGFHGYAQRDPLVEYKNEAFHMFEELVEAIQADIVVNVYRAEVRVEEPPPMPEAPRVLATSGPGDPSGDHSAGVAPAGNGQRRNGPSPPRDLARGPQAVGAGSVATAVASGKVGRNDPCPCGSGRKYKRCHGR